MITQVTALQTAELADMSHAVRGLQPADTVAASQVQHNLLNVKCIICPQHLTQDRKFDFVHLCSATFKSFKLKLVISNIFDD